MTHPIELMLCELERDYFDGVSFDRLTTRIETIAEAVLALDGDDPLRQVFEANAAALWGAVGPSRLAVDVVHSRTIDDRARK